MSKLRLGALALALVMGLGVAVAHAAERPGVVVLAPDGEAPAASTDAATVVGGADGATGVEAIGAAPVARVEPVAAPLSVSDASNEDDVGPVPQPSPGDRAPGIIDRPRLTDGKWYGWQTLAADVVAIGLGLACGETGGNWNYCVFPFLFAGPVVHGFHGNPGRGVVGVGTRFVLPLVGVVFGVGGSADRELSENLLIGALVGAGAAAALDLAFAFDSRGTPPEPRGRSARGPSVTPALALGRGDAVVGVSGRF